jgi:hypothetical protein
MHLEYVTTHLALFCHILRQRLVVGRFDGG